MYILFLELSKTNRTKKSTHCICNDSLLFSRYICRQASPGHLPKVENDPSVDLCFFIIMICFFPTLLYCMRKLQLRLEPFLTLSCYCCRVQIE